VYFSTIVLLFHHSPLLFDTTVRDPYATVVAAVWVTEGSDRCVVGHVNPAAIAHFERLEGRLCQVVEIFSSSKSKSKLDYSAANNGVVLAQIINKYVPGDDILNNYVEVIDSDDEN